MSRIIKTVSLDKKTDAIASQKPNFSAWVRNQLLNEDEDFQNTHVTLSIFREKGICNPSASPRCAICYPHGKPTLPNIKAWNQGLISNSQLTNTVEPKELVGFIATGSEWEHVEEPIAKEPVLRERKYLRRAIKWIWAFI